MACRAEGVLARKLRLVLTALAIVLGVGFVSGTLVLTDTALSAFDDLFGDIFSKTDVVVQAENAFQDIAAGGGGGGARSGTPSRRRSSGMSRRCRVWQRRTAAWAASRR